MYPWTLATTNMAFAKFGRGKEMYLYKNIKAIILELIE